MTRYFPELVEAVKAELPQRCVIDGEIVIATGRRAGLRGAAAAHPPGRIAGDDAGRADAGLASSPSTCWPSATTTTPVARSPSAAPLSRTRLADARAADPPHADHHRPRRCAALVRRVRGRRPRRRDRQAARRHLPARQARHVQDQARRAPPTACSPASAGTRPRRTPRRWSARCCSASTTTRASCSTSASSAPSPPSGAPNSSTS